MTDQADQAGGIARALNLDVSRPNVARVYDYLLGGKDHFAADREAARQLIAALPNAVAVAKANRTFLAAAVRHAARDGVAQYLDIGAGLPTSPSVDESARAVVPAARVVYVDHDPVVVTYARALLETRDGVIALEGDAREPEAILADPTLSRVLDLTKPVCVLLVSMLHFFAADQADMIVGAFRRRMAPGSYLVISQGNYVPVDGEGVQNAYGSGVTLVGRTADEIAAYFDGCDLVPPGLVPVAEWPAAQPGAWPPPRKPTQATVPQAGMLAGVGRKRS